MFDGINCGRVDRGTSGQVDEWTGGRVDERTSERVDRWTGGRGDRGTILCVLCENPLCTLR